jgi:hypothetical protein
MTARLGQRPTTGRRLPKVANYVCDSCEIRKAIGKPRVNDTWAQRLRLSQAQIDELILAAAEYEDLCVKSDTITNAVDFIDWVSPEALGMKVA